jgi:FAD/FMN-containing dehydrogenase
VSCSVRPASLLRRRARRYLVDRCNVLHPAFWRPVPAGGCPDAHPQRLFNAVEEMLTAVEHGGTVSGEHDIGVAMMRWLKAEISPASSALQHIRGRGAPVRG